MRALKAPLRAGLRFGDVSQCDERDVFTAAQKAYPAEIGVCKALRLASSIVILVSFALLTTSVGQRVTDDNGSHVPTVPVAGGARAPRIEPKLMGVYGADGKFKKLTKTSRLGAPGQSKRAAVPEGVNLEPRQSVIADVAPPARGVKVMKTEPAFVTARDSFLAAIYGREPLLHIPARLTTDSRQRLIVVDRGRSAVHVLAGKESFRIAGGPGLRLQRPNGVAVDGDDNLYISDGGHGVVLVYDSMGRYLRELGRYGGENMFHNPTAIAIERKAGRLYVLDSPANELIVLDLHGTLVGRFGGRRARNVSFIYPTEVAVGGDTIAVLDDAGTRIQILDSNCRLVRTLRIGEVTGPPTVAAMGFALDEDGNVYVSREGTSTVQIFDRTGQLLGSFIDLHATGLWVAPHGIYLADARNSRILRFEPMTHPNGPPAAGR